MLTAPIGMLLSTWLFMPVDYIHNASELELAGILMLKNINNLQNVDAGLHFSASKFPLTQVGLHYKSNQVAYIIWTTVASQ